jgi:cytochrome c biogenesis protein CcmG/thiol:disulfide interchange protein DsbE
LPEIHTGLPGLSNTDLLGNYGLLNIFGSWCIACKIEHLFLMKLKENNIIPIYGIAWRDTSEKLNNYLKENGNPYNNIGSDSTGKTIIDLGITGAPETFLISPDGRVLFHYAGPITDEIWNKEILPLINRGI